MHAQSGQIAAVLGLPDPSAVTFLDLAARCEDGLPVESLYALVRTLAPNQPDYRKTLMTQPTLRRRKKQGALNAAESDMVVRLATIWVVVLHAFGDEEKARGFLLSDHALLAGRKPVELAATNLAGAQAVEQMLGRLRYGSAA